MEHAVRHAPHSNKNKATLIHEVADLRTELAAAKAEAAAAQQAAREAAAELTNQVYSKNAEFTPAITRRPGQFEPMEQQIGVDDAPECVEDRHGEAVIQRVRVTDVDDPEFTEKQANMAFMNELVTVFIHSTNEKNADQVFDVAVNGMSCLFRRNETKTVKRLFVEGLARAKPATFDNQEYTDTDGVRKFRYPVHNGLRYPFSIVEDRNPMGPRWLAHVLAQP